MARPHHQPREADYVVVGGGTAGCVVASRLAADAGARVVLLEAGDRPPAILSIPLVGLWAWLQRPGRYTWEYQTVPQAALADRTIAWPAGRLIGGSSGINAMIYNRGHRAGYDRWRTGTRPEWSYDELLPYFRRAERFDQGNSPFHGGDGLLAVSDTRYLHPLADAFIAGCGEVGIPPTDDFNGASPIGAGYFQVTQRHGRRASTANFLPRSSDAGGLTVLVRARVTRVLFERGRAVGVEYLTRGRVCRLRAGQEVILCTGAVRSPQLLMLSGVGPAASLRRHGIPVVADRGGVGANLQDHLRVPVVRHLAARRPTNLRGLLRGGVEYLRSHRGLLTSIVCDAGAVVRADADGDVPNIRVVCRWRVMPQQPTTLVDFEVVAIDPLSTGRVTLRSADPMEDPAIDPRYLTHSRDFETLIRGMALAREIASTPACRAAGVGNEYLPGTRNVADHIRDTGDSAYHPVGTCRLGSDAEAVVSPELRVIGVEGVRVVDASVMPTTVPGNAAAAVTAIAERAADLIRDRGSEGLPSIHSRL